MLLATIEVEEWVVGRYSGSSAQGRLHQAGSACAGAAGATRRTACAGAWGTRPEAANAAARSSLDDSGIHAAKNPPACVRKMSVFAIGRL